MHFDNCFYLLLAVLCAIFVIETKLILLILGFLRLNLVYKLLIYGKTAYF